MDIQGIHGFQLTARSVTAADGRSPTRAQRPHSANMSTRFRSPADMGTVDFRKGLEVYIPPKAVKRPSSSQSRKSRSKETFLRYGPKVSCSQLRDNVLDVKEKENELQAMTNGDKNGIAPQVQASNTRISDTEVFESSEYQQGSSVPSPDSKVTDASMVCTCGGLDDVGVEGKRHHGDYASSQESKAWFEKTLQEYEDLNKSVKAHISSAPSDQRNELVSGTDPRCVQLLWEEVSLQYKTSGIHADEVDKKNGNFSSVSPACSPAFSLTTYTCGCPATPCSIRPPSNRDMTKVQDAAWKEVVDAVSQLRETNRALQRTVKELQDPPHQKQRYELGVPTEFAKPGGPPHIPGLSTTVHEPEMRKRILGTLRSSVHRMESLMVALRNEQEKSKLLSLQLQGFLSASGERTPPVSVNGSRSTSPVQRVSSVCDDTSHQRKDPSRSPSPTPVMCARNTDAPKEKLSNVANLSGALCDVQVVSLSDNEL
ncbi:hypothetical protein R1sor_019722 [Riccia sorocarpa]|uniref:Coiled-coil domain-containing protein 52 n=1 Tax=Riccia sorocarpa TaxID=122646 RepID=A0ABD3IDB8_9MARC